MVELELKTTMMKRARTLAFWMAMSMLYAQAQPKQAPPQGTVHIYRDKLSSATAAHPTVSCDAFAVVRIQNGRVYSMKVSAGRHTFTTTNDPTGITVDVESGKEYFVRIDFTVNAKFRGDASPVLVPEEQGRMETLKLRPLDGRYIEAATCGRP
jgi:hypothetical protein